MSKKQCKDCKWCEVDTILGLKQGERYAKCLNPNNGKNASGFNSPTFVYCASQRGGPMTSWLFCRLAGFCGACGRWFEPKEESK